MARGLSLATLGDLPAAVARPAFDPARLRTGIVHLGLGNFHRTHQAVFTEDAIAKAGGDWGIIGVSLMRPDTPRALAPQNNLYTLEILGDERRYRVMGVLRRSLTASDDATAIVDALASRDTHIVTLTVTEKGYCLGNGGALDFEHPDIRHDLAHPDDPRSAIGWLVRGLAARKTARGGELTIIACDNLPDNGGKLARATLAFARAIDPTLAPWIADCVRFPCTMVDCIVPATDASCRERVDAALRLHDNAPVMREAFAQWVIEDRFAGPRPRWEEAGVEIITDVAPLERLKLHVLNASHSALAYLGIPRGHRFVREAIADAELSRFVDALIDSEVAPALAPLDVNSYWRSVRARFANRSLDHRLEQIAEDGSVKLAQRVFPLLVANVHSGAPHERLAAIVRAWLDFARKGSVKDPARERLAAWAESGGGIENALDDPALFPDAFRSDARVRQAILSSPIREANGGRWQRA
jgi:fructuronate reductase